MSRLILLTILATACATTDEPDPTSPAGCEPSVERCDGFDNDCDGVIDEEPTDGIEAYPDLDGDGFGTGAPQRVCVVGEGLATASGDCADDDDAVYPGAPERCDGADNDCDPVTMPIDAVVFRPEQGEERALFWSKAPGPVTAEVIDEPGDLSICGGPWAVSLTLEAPVRVAGEGSEPAVLDAGLTAATVIVEAPGETIELVDLELRGGVASTPTCVADLPGFLVGGGLLVQNQTLVQGTRLLIRDNLEGGVRVCNATVELVDSEIVDNVARGGGGVQANERGSVTLRRTLVARNLVAIIDSDRAVGGGIGLARNSFVRLEGSVVRDNVADLGGGIYISSGELECVSTTDEPAGVLANDARVDGGGIAVGGSGGAFRIDAVGCDFGTDGDDNSPTDLELLDPGSNPVSLGNNETFDCSSESCSLGL